MDAAYMGSSSFEAQLEGLVQLTEPSTLASMGRRDTYRDTAS